MRFHNFHNFLCQRLMGKKIKLETFPQDFIINFTDASLPGSPGI